MSSISQSDHVINEVEFAVNNFVNSTSKYITFVNGTDRQNK